jgi:hypothetical protein
MLPRPTAEPAVARTKPSLPEKELLCCDIKTSDKNRISKTTVLLHTLCKKTSTIQ